MEPQQTSLQCSNSQFLYVNNPFFVPEAPPVNTSISARIYSTGSAPNVAFPIAFQEYMFVGKGSSFEWAEFSNVGSKFEFQESTSVSVFVFINATQYYLDQRLRPVHKDIDVHFELVQANGTVLTEAFCKRPPQIVMKLQRETFVAASNVSFSFCSPVSTTVTLVMTYNISDVDGFPVIKYASSLPFELKRRGPMTLTESKFSLANSSAFVGEYDGPSVVFTLNSTASGLLCSLVQFDYIVDTVCGSNSNMPSLFNASRTHQTKVTSVIGTSQSCETQVSKWSFVTPARNCTIRLSVPSLNLTTLSQQFSILPGKAVAFALIGNITCASAGAFVWSVSTQRDSRSFGNSTA